MFITLSHVLLIMIDHTGLVCSFTRVLYICIEYVVLHRKQIDILLTLQLILSLHSN